MALAVAVTSLGCSRDEFPDRSAVVEVDGRSTRFDLVSCGLDGTTAYVTGASDDGDVVQAVVGVEERDHETGVPGFTGLTVSEGAEERGAFGAGAWAARRKAGDPPGSVLAARIRGSRIQVSGRVVLLDDAGDPTGTDGSGVPFSLDARCDEV